MEWQSNVFKFNSELIILTYSVFAPILFVRKTDLRRFIVDDYIDGFCN